MCTVCGLLEKGEGGLIVERKYPNDTTNRRNSHAHSYTDEGREMLPDAPRFEYVKGDPEYIAPVISFYSSSRMGETPREYAREERSNIESLAA